MEVKEVVAIDVSKEENEAIIHSSQEVLCFDNNNNGYKKLEKWVLKNTKVDKEEILFSFEHTGLYSFPLSLFLAENNYSFVLLPGLELKRSMGIVRGKSDKIDARRIALYTYEKRERIKPYQMPKEEIIQLKRLLSLRERLVKQCSGYKASLGEYKRFLKRKDNLTLFEVQEKMIRELTKQVDKVDKQLDGLIKNNEQLRQMYNLIISIKGVGPQTALFVISLTHGFLKFETWRKFASYSGTAPFPYQSGTSIRGKSKVSKLANRKMKSLLELCARSAIQHNPEMKIYYKRRVKEGKSKQSTLNIIRNKLIARIFAVVNRQTSYVNILKYAS